MGCRICLHSVSGHHETRDMDIVASPADSESNSSSNSDEQHPDKSLTKSVPYPTRALTTGRMRPGWLLTQQQLRQVIRKSGLAHTRLASQQQGVRQAPLLQHGNYPVTDRLQPGVKIRHAGNYRENTSGRLDFFAIHYCPGTWLKNSVSCRPSR